MDESFNEYIDAIAEAHINNQPTDWQNRSAGYRRIAGTENEAPMMWFSDYAGPGYGVQTYSKAEISLNALGGIVGDSAVGRAFAEYAKAWKFKHPTPYDFFFSMNKSLGKNLDWFWYQWYFTTFTADQAIESVATSGSDAILTVRDKGDMVAPVIAAIEFTDGSKGRVVLPAERWFSGRRTLTERIPLNGRIIKSVTLDPVNRFQDLDRSNNVWTSSGK